MESGFKQAHDWLCVTNPLTPRPHSHPSILQLFIQNRTTDILEYSNTKQPNHVMYLVEAHSKLGSGKSQESRQKTEGGVLTVPGHKDSLIPTQDDTAPLFGVDHGGEHQKGDTGVDNRSCSVDDRQKKDNAPLRLNLMPDQNNNKTWELASLCQQLQ